MDTDRRHRGVARGVAPAFLLLVWVLGSTPAIAESTNTAALTKSLAAVYAYVNDQLAEKDPDGALAYYSPNFIAVGTGNHQVDFKGLKATFAELTSPQITVSVSTRITKLTISGTTVTADVVETQSIDFREARSGTSSGVTTNLAARDTWSLAGNRWQKLSAVILDAKFAKTKGVHVSSIVHW